MLKSSADMFCTVLSGGIMGVGKATVATLDNNAKHKIMFKARAYTRSLF